MGTVTVEKDALRRKLLARRNRLPDREERDRKWQERLFSLPHYRESPALLLYLSVESEPDTWPVLENALKQGKAVYAPCCLDREGRMAFYRVFSRGCLAPGPFGIWEPDPARCPPWKGEAALCLVPGLAFDRKGFRLGYGKGYYDRFLADFRGASVGLCYGPLLLPDLPRGPYDRPVDVVLADTGILPGKEGNV